MVPTNTKQYGCIICQYHPDRGKPHSPCMTGWQVSLDKPRLGLPALAATVGTPLHASR